MRRGFSTLSLGAFGPRNPMKNRAIAAVGYGSESTTGSVTAYRAPPWARACSVHTVQKLSTLTLILKALVGQVGRGTLGPADW